VTTFSAINTVYINPNVVWTATPGLHIAGGLAYVPSSVTLRNRLELTPSPDGDAEIEANGDGWGYNVAILADLPAHNQLGISFRSAVNIDYSGDATFSPLGLADRVTSSLTLPPTLTVGLAHHPSNQLTLEMDWQWVGWASVDKITIDFADPTFPIADVEMPKNWKDSSSLRFGVERAFERSTFRAGYAYDMSPIPSETIDPSIADSDKHTFALGGGYRFDRITVDLAYMFIVSKDREVGNTLQTGGTPFDHRGKYSTRIHELGLGFSYRF
jgi:long-chain fatty acid transport protein